MRISTFYAFFRCSNLTVTQFHLPMAAVPRHQPRTGQFTAMPPSKRFCDMALLSGDMGIQPAIWWGCHLSPPVIFGGFGGTFPWETWVCCCFCCGTLSHQRWITGCQVDQGSALKSLTFLALKPHHGPAYFGLLDSWTGPKSSKSVWKSVDPKLYFMHFHARNHGFP